MAIPDFQTLMLPLLKFSGDGKPHSLREAIDALATQFKLTEQDRTELLPSGKQARFDNRVHWARSYLKQANLLMNPQRSYFQITDIGSKTLKLQPDHINIKFLEQFDSFIAFRNRSHQNKNGQIETESLIATPEEELEQAAKSLGESLSAEIIETIKNCSPNFFENLVVDLIVSMGYGGSRKEAGQAVGKSGDGGIDGIINEDRLGLDVIYLQAKRWDSVVGRPEIQKFAGALQGVRARKGIFITTSSFSQGALNFTKHIDPKIILIDGAKLSELMVEHNVGITSVAKYEIKRLDSDYFSEE